MLNPQTETPFDSACSLAGLGHQVNAKNVKGPRRRSRTVVGCGLNHFWNETHQLKQDTQNHAGFNTPDISCKSLLTKHCWASKTNAWKWCVSPAGGLRTNFTITSSVPPLNTTTGTKHWRHIICIHFYILIHLYVLNTDKCNKTSPGNNAVVYILYIFGNIVWDLNILFPLCCCNI